MTKNDDNKIESDNDISEDFDKMEGIAENIKLGMTEFQAICRVAHYEMDHLL